jgi:ATP-dependent Clp protease adaptor protein ClpS
MPQSDIKTKTQTTVDIKEPPMWKVIYLNDELTSMEFVIDSLIEHFEYTSTAAEKVTVDIHENGAAVVALLPYEVAEHKGMDVTMAARQAGYPLQIRLEPENAGSQ